MIILHERLWHVRYLFTTSKEFIRNETQKEWKLFCVLGIGTLRFGTPSIPISVHPLRFASLHKGYDEKQKRQILSHAHKKIEMSSEQSVNSLPMCFGKVITETAILTQSVILHLNGFYEERQRG